MKDLSPRRMRWTLLVMMLMICALMLSGCAGPQKIACEEPRPLPAELTAPLTPDARAYSADVRSFLREAESWLKTQPQSTTPSSKQ